MKPISASPANQTAVSEVYRGTAAVTANITPLSITPPGVTPPRTDAAASKNPLRVDGSDLAVRDAGRPIDIPMPMIGGAPTLRQPSVSASDDVAPSAIDLAVLSAEFGKMVMESSLQQMTLRANHSQSFENAMDKINTRKANEAEEARRKAEKVQSIWGTIFKVASIVLVAVSLAAAAFTGGATFVIAVALFAVDTGMEIATGKSLTARAMDPVMQFAVETFKNFATALQGLGLSEAAAFAIAAVVSYIAINILVVALVKVGGPALRTVAKRIPDMIKHAGRSIGRGLSKVRINKKNWEGSADTVKHLAGAGSSISHAGNSGQALVQANFRLDAAELEAGMVLIGAERDSHSELSDAFANIGNRAQALMEALTTSTRKMLNAQNDVNTNIIANARAA